MVLSSISSAIGMLTGIIIFTFSAITCSILMKIRAWKRQLKSVNPENQAEIYQTLCILMSEQDPKEFESRISQFAVVWETKEPAFVKYFGEYYHTRAGIVFIFYVRMYIIIIVIVLQRSGPNVTGTLNMETQTPTCILKGILCMLSHSRGTA